MKGSVWGGRLAGAAMAALLATTTLVRAETLTDALISTYKASNLLDQNRALLRAADEDVADAVSALRPVVNFVAQASQTDGGLNDDLQSSIGLSADMTLYDFGRSKLGIDVARETVLATREALLNVEQQVLLSGVQAFMQVRSASENVTLNENSVRVISEELKAAQDRFEVGEITRTDVALAQARLAGADASLAAAKGSLAAAREAYKAATGHYPGKLSAAPRPPKLPRTLDEAVAIAQASHPSLRQAQHQVAAAELGVKLAGAARKPNLSAGADIQVDQDGDDVSQLNLTFSAPIYAGGALSASHRRAIAQRDAARAALLNQSVNISQAVGQAWADLAVARAQIVATDEQIRAQTVAYRGVREEATLGARTTLDVLDAEQDLLDAQASRIEAEAQFNLAIYSLLASMGLLTVDHLNLGIPTYDPEAYYNAVRNAPSTSLQGERLDRVLRAIGNE